MARFENHYRSAPSREARSQLLRRGPPPPPRRGSSFLAATLWLARITAATLIVFAAGLAFAQVPAAAAPAGTTVAVQLPAWSWGELVSAVVGAALIWFARRAEPHVHAFLQAKAADPAAPKAVRTLAEIGAELEPLVASAVGHAYPAFQAAIAAGKDPGEVSRGAATDLVEDLEDGVKTEAEKYLGPAGGAVVDFVDGLIKNEFHSLQAAKVQTAVAAGAAAGAAAASSGPAAVAVLNAPAS